MGYTLPHNTNGLIVEKYFKIKHKYTHKGASRFKADLNKHKEMFLNNNIEGSGVFSSRKEASVCYSIQLPRRAHSLGDRMNSIRSSIKQKRKGKVSSTKENNPNFDRQHTEGGLLGMIHDGNL